MSNKWKLHLTAVDKDNRIAVCFIETDAEWMAANLSDAEAIKAGFKLTEIIAYEYTTNRRQVSCHAVGGHFVLTISKED